MVTLITLWWRPSSDCDGGKHFCENGYPHHIVMKVIVMGVTIHYGPRKLRRLCNIDTYCAKFETCKPKSEGYKELQIKRKNMQRRNISDCFHFQTYLYKWLRGCSIILIWFYPWHWISCVLLRSILSSESEKKKFKKSIWENGSPHHIVMKTIITMWWG